jgi:PAS domain S-box-containing protein
MTNNSDFETLQDLNELIEKLKISEAEARKESDRQLRIIDTLINAIPDIILFVGEDHKIIWGNDAAAARISSLPRFLPGLPCYSIFHEDSPCQHCPVDIVLKSQMNYKIDVEHKGEFYEIYSAPVQPNGTLGIICIARNISHRKRNAEILRKAFLRANGLSNASNQGIVIHRDNQVLVTNRAFEDMTGYREYEVQEDFDIMWKILAPEFRDMVRKRIENENTEPYRAEYITKDGNRIMVKVTPKEMEYNSHGLCRVAIIERTD